MTACSTRNPPETPCSATATVPVTATWAKTVARVRDPKKYKMAKHFDLDITDASLTITRNTSQTAAEAALDSIYVIRTTVTADTLDPAGVVGAYKRLANGERDFRTINVDDLDLRPVFHRLKDRVRAHVFIAMLAAPPTTPRNQRTPYTTGAHHAQPAQLRLNPGMNR